MRNMRLAVLASDYFCYVRSRAVPTETQREQEPGFEVVLAAAGLLLMALLIKRKTVRHP
ncbi:MAG: hypothetical protein KAJ93_04660 [Methanosarcinales archaeon]|nr:hypothetical protein [Methanosarcinales archaeon]